MLSVSQRAAFRTLIQEKTGVFIPPKKDYLLDARIAKLMQALGVDSAKNVLEALQNDDPRVIDAFTKAVTTNHTYFFRESEHFFKVVENLRQRAVDTPHLWMAACSTGEEVWSMAISLLEGGFQLFRILASDINIHNLRYLKEGIYPESRFHHMPPVLIRKYFSRTTLPNGEAGYVVNPLLRQFVAARRMNLLEQVQLARMADIIFCRNVLMYFDRQTQAVCLHNLVSNLQPGGLLLIGQSETLDFVPHGLHLLALSVFQKGKHE